MKKIYYKGNAERFKIMAHFKILFFCAGFYYYFGGTGNESISDSVSVKCNCHWLFDEGGNGGI